MLALSWQHPNVRNAKTYSKSVTFDRFFNKKSLKIRKKSIKIYVYLDEWKN